MITVTNVECQWLDDLQTRLADLNDPLEQAGEGLLAAMRENITGGRLAPLAASTRAEKTKHGQSSSPLIGTGGLLDSLRPGGRDNVIEVTGDTVTVGTDNPNAVYAVTGGRNRPVRDFTKINDQAKDDIADAIADWIQGDR